jgi:hypothetical protein
MELTLNIYEGRKVVKTYKEDSLHVSFGVVEDFIDIIRPENVDINNQEQLAGAVIKFLPLIRPLFIDIFDGLTHEELRKTDIKEIVQVSKDIITFMIAEIRGITKGKN